MKKTLYQKTKTNKIQQWTVWVEEKGQSGFPEVWIEHGQTDGKKQTTFDVIKEGVNIGKANETTPVQQAHLEMERKITKRLEHGYVEDVNKTQEKKTIDFNAILPKELCFYKPNNSIEKEDLLELDKNKKAIYTIKRDGQMHVVRVSKKYGLEVYTRKMDIATEKYPHLHEALKQLPDGTILLGEMILEKNGKDDFNSVSSICRSDPEEALSKQNELGKISYYIFDLAFLNEENLLANNGYAERLKKLNDIFKNIKSPYIKLVEVVNKNHKEALKETTKRELEGLVVWDADGIIKEDRYFTFNGKASRPKVVWKYKLKYEDDFIVRWDPDNNIGEYGTGKNHTKLRSVAVYQLDEQGNEIYLGNCGGGLSDEQKTFYTNKSLYPRVWRIEYDSIQNKTGSPRFPVYNTDRTLLKDKELKECLMSDTIKLARSLEDDGEEE